MKLELAISPCPNDTYIFYHMIHSSEHPYQFETVFEDVEELNRRAIQEGRHVITKMSYFAYLQCENSYTMIQAGGALGRGCGPLFIASHEQTSRESFTTSASRIP